jgi:hypothetical protein
MCFSKYFGFPLSIITQPIINCHSSTFGYIQSAYSIYYKETSEITPWDPYGTCPKTFDHSDGKDGHYSRELGLHIFGLAAAHTDRKPVCAHTAIRLCCLLQYVRGGIQNIPDLCRHLYSSCGSAKHRYMVGLPCLVSQCAKLHLAGWIWAVFTRVYLESCTWPVAIFTMDQRKEQRMWIQFCANLGKSATETLTMIQLAFGDQILSRTQMFQ